MSIHPEHVHHNILWKSFKFLYIYLYIRTRFLLLLLAFKDPYNLLQLCFCLSTLFFVVWSLPVLYTQLVVVVALGLTWLLIFKTQLITNLQEPFLTPHWFFFHPPTLHCFKYLYFNLVFCYFTFVILHYVFATNLNCVIIFAFLFHFTISSVQHDVEYSRYFISSYWIMN